MIEELYLDTVVQAVVRLRHLKADTESQKADYL